MAYNSLVATVGPGLLSAALNPGFTNVSGVGAPTSLIQLPSAINFAFGATGVGNINELGIYGGTVVGTTASINLNSTVDIYGTAKVWTLVRAILICNYATTAGFTLLYDGSSGVTNAFLSPFNTPTPSATLPKLAIQEGFVDSASVTHPGVGLLVAGNSGYVVSPTNCVIKLDPGANTVRYEVYIVGQGN